LAWIECGRREWGGSEHRWVEFQFKSLVLEAEERQGNAGGLLGAAWDIASGCGARRVMHLQGEDGEGVNFGMGFADPSGDFDIETMHAEFGPTFACWAPAGRVSPEARRAGEQLIARATVHDFAALHAAAEGLGYVPSDLRPS
ncbi:MAG: hypothetical protein AAFS11_08000, partial [Planctomycetota bacterium]